MRTMIDIQDDLMTELLREADTKNKKNAVVLAIRTFLDMKRRKKLAALIGNYEFGYSSEEPERMRKDVHRVSSVTHDHYISALTAIQNGKYARHFKSGEPLPSEIFAASKQEEKEREERRRTS